MKINYFYILWENFSEQQVQQHGQHDADDDAGHDREVERPALASHTNIAGQTAQGQAQALDQPDHGSHHNQQDAEYQNPDFNNQRYAALDITAE